MACPEEVQCCGVPRGGAVLRRVLRRCSIVACPACAGFLGQLATPGYARDSLGNSWPPVMRRVLRATRDPHLYAGFLGQLVTPSYARDSSGNA